MLRFAAVHGTAPHKPILFPPPTLEELLEPPVYAPAADGDRPRPPADAGRRLSGSPYHRYRNPHARPSPDRQRGFHEAHTADPDPEHAHRRHEETAIPFSFQEILILLLVLLLIFGAKKLPETARAIGASLREFRDGVEKRGP